VCLRFVNHKLNIAVQKKKKKKKDLN